MAQIYRCGQCDESWPHADGFKDCPGCGTPCAAVIIADENEPDEEAVVAAMKRAAYVRFERYLNEETDEERRIREANSPYRDDFHRVIESAGFQDWERQSILDAENALKEKAA